MRRFRATERCRGYAFFAPPSTLCTAHYTPSIHGLSSLGRACTANSLRPVPCSAGGGEPMRGAPERGRCRLRRGAPSGTLRCLGWLFLGAWETVRDEPFASARRPLFRAWGARAGKRAVVGDLGVTCGCVAKEEGPWGIVKMEDCGCAIWGISWTGGSLLHVICDRESRRCRLLMPIASALAALPGG